MPHKPSLMLHKHSLLFKRGGTPFSPLLENGNPVVACGSTGYSTLCRRLRTSENLPSSPPSTLSYFPHLSLSVFLFIGTKLTLWPWPHCGEWKHKEQNWLSCLEFPVTWSTWKQPHIRCSIQGSWSFLYSSSAYWCVICPLSKNVATSYLMLKCP